MHLIMHLLLFLSSDWLIFCHMIISLIAYKFTQLFIYFMFLSDKRLTLETLDFTIRTCVGSTPTFLYFDLYLNTTYAAHYSTFTHNLFREISTVMC